MFIKFPPSSSRGSEITVNTSDIISFLPVVEGNEISLKIRYRIAGDKESVNIYRYQSEEELNKAYLMFAKLVGVQEFDGGNYLPYVERPFSYI